jgi:hypothetical protein
MDAHRDEVFEIGEDYEDANEVDFEFEDEHDSDDDNDVDADDVDEGDGSRSGDEMECEVECADDKPYPILLTVQQREALIALNQALHNGKTLESLLELFHAVSIAIFTTQRSDAEQRHFYLPLEFFTIAFNSRKDGSIRKPVSMAPNVNVQQYWAQFTIMRDAITSPAPISEYVHLLSSPPSLISGMQVFEKARQVVELQ